MKKSRHVFTWCFRNFVTFAQRGASCAICGRPTCRCRFVLCVVPLHMRSSGKRREPALFVIFSRTRPTRERTSMDEKSSIQPNVGPTHLGAGKFDIPLTNGRFVYTMSIQPTLRGKNFLAIRRSYAQIS